MNNKGNFMIAAVISTIIFIFIFSIWYNHDTKQDNTISNVETTIKKQISSSMSIAEINKDPQTFINKTVTITGVAILFHNPYKNCKYPVEGIKDQNGNVLNVCPNRINRFDGGEVYTVKGLIYKDYIFKGEDEYLLKEE